MKGEKNRMSVEKMEKKIVVGMSGGVDSSISLLLLKKEGWKPVGVSLKLAVWENEENCLKENVCCTKESFDIARKVCREMGAEHYVYDVSKEFRKEVMDYFVNELKNNRTPNPCTMCNKNLKFEKLIEWAGKNGINYVATGHYAKNKFNQKNGKYELFMAKDGGKDQSYGLCMLAQKQLKHIIFPLGKYLKKEVYEIAEKEGMSFLLKKKQSQDLCFLSNKSYLKFVEKNIKGKEGNIVDKEGNFLGKHNGLHFYTRGQRAGISGGKAYYVKKFELQKNELVVTSKKEELKQKEIFLSNYNFISGE
ncbi:MAG: tRNA 2-thiouridine(34) synthase MnmA, partial [Candidatus Micrarchaeota archaeon]